MNTVEAILLARKYIDHLNAAQLYQFIRQIADAGFSGDPGTLLEPRALLRDPPPVLAEAIQCEAQRWLRHDEETRAMTEEP